jgi:hypothetical protein
MPVFAYFIAADQYYPSVGASHARASGGTHLHPGIRICEMLADGRRGL